MLLNRDSSPADGVVRMTQRILKKYQTQLMVFNLYAQFYDTLYRDKDYPKESQFLIKLFNRYSNRPVKQILDLGCGTASHAICLARRGLQITGVDRSHQMLKIAQDKVLSAGLQIRLVRGDLQTVDLSAPLDAAISMFAVLGYLKTEAYLLRALSNIRRYLKRRGLFIFDLWYGPAVLNDPPKGRTKKSKLKSGELILRKSHCTLHREKQTVDVCFDTAYIKSGKKTIESQEVHSIKYYFLPQIASYLRRSAFKIVKACPFMNVDQAININTWNLCVIAEAV